jgi:hypothetical protein
MAGALASRAAAVVVFAGWFQPTVLAQPGTVSVEPTVAGEQSAEGLSPQAPASFPELFCEGWMASLPGITIRTHVFSEPQVILVELAGRGRRQSVIVNAESWTVTGLENDPPRSRNLFRFEFSGGLLELPFIHENQTTAAMLILTGNAAKDLSLSPASGPFRVLVQCRGLPDPGLAPG